MRILLDTHIFLWFITADSRLSTSHRNLILSTRNEVFLSVASVWEATIKYSLGKLSLPSPPEVYLPIQRERHLIASLVIDEGSIAHLARLPQLHRDPFDRVMICQAVQHDLTILTVDEMFQRYPVKTAMEMQQ